VHRLRWQQGVVRIHQWFIAAQVQDEPMPGSDDVREGVEAYHVLLDCPRLHRDGTRVRVVRVTGGVRLARPHDGGGARSRPR